MDTNTTRLQHLFARYAGGDITAEEERELMEYVADASYRDEIYRLMSETWERESTSASMDPRTMATLIERITATRSRSNWSLVYRVAAAFVILALAGSASFYYYTQSASNATATVHSPLPDPRPPKALVLADGSTVILKEGSELFYPESFDGASRRTVTLKGEGFFDIVHDPEKPFVVQTGALQTHVLGTAFVIRAYDEDTHITVIVSRGKVQVTDEQRVIGTLTKDQQITFDKQRHLSEQQTVKSDSTLAWTRRDIYFDDITFAEAALQLSARFNVKVHFEEERASQCRFTATFIEGESFAKIMEVICAFNHAGYRQTEPGVFIIEGPGC